MKIGIDAHAAERDGSGNCTYIRGLIRGLLEIDRENDYVFYVINEKHPFYEEVREDRRVCLHALPARNPLLRIPVFLAAASYRDRIDVLHVQYIAPPRHRGALAVTIHDMAHLHLPGTFSRFEVLRSRLLVPRTARAAERIITGSEGSRKDIIADCGVEPSRVEVVPYGVSGSFAVKRDGEAGRDVPAKYGIRVPYILCVGRLNARKNIATLAEAFALAKKREALPHALVIAGKKDHGSAGVLSAVRRTGGGEVLFTGFVPDEDLPHLYARADVLVYPSLFEGFGLPILEGLAAGVPVVASDTPALRETLGEAGLAVSPLQPEAIAAAISRLVKDRKLRQDLIARGLARAAEFTWRKSARLTLAVYEQAAAARRQRR